MSPRKKPTWAIDPLVTAAGAVIKHGDTLESHTVLAASREHAALAVLAALDKAARLQDRIDALRAG